MFTLLFLLGALLSGVVSYVLSAEIIFAVVSFILSLFGISIG